MKEISRRWGEQPLASVCSAAGLRTEAEARPEASSPLAWPASTARPSRSVMIATIPGPEPIAATLAVSMKTELTRPRSRPDVPSWTEAVDTALIMPVAATLERECQGRRRD